MHDEGKKQACDILKGVCCFEAALLAPVLSAVDVEKAQLNLVVCTYRGAGGTGWVSGDAEFSPEASETISWDKHKFS